MEEEVQFESSEGLKLSGVLHIPKNKRDVGIIICHGFGRNKDLPFIPELARELEKRNFLVLRFDFSGCGESEGKFETRTYSKWVEDLKSAIDWFKDKSKEICVIGHSMGGSVAIIEYSKYRNFESLILLAPGIEFKLPERFWKILNEKGYLKVRILNRTVNLPKSYYLDRDKYNYFGLVNKIDIPTLMILAKEDKIIDNENCKKFFQLLKCKKKIEIVDGDHGFNHDASKILNPIVNFLIQLIL